jgi:hypothetical protein
MSEARNCVDLLPLFPGLSSGNIPRMRFCWDQFHYAIGPGSWGRLPAPEPRPTVTVRPVARTNETNAASGNPEAGHFAFRSFTLRALSVGRFCFRSKNMHRHTFWLTSELQNISEADPEASPGFSVSEKLAR